MGCRKCEAHFQSITRKCVPGGSEKKWKETDEKNKAWFQQLQNEV